jgi:hypothetical protein
MAKPGAEAGTRGDVLAATRRRWRAPSSARAARCGRRAPSCRPRPRAGSLTRLTPGRGDRRDIGFSGPPLSKGGHRALGCLRGTDLRKIDRRACTALFMRFVSRNCAVSAIISTMLASVHPASYWASDTPPRASMRVFANATAACRFGLPGRPCRFSAISSGGLRQVRRAVAVRGKAVVAPVRLRHRQRDSVPGLHVQSLRTATPSGQPSPRGRSG